MYNQYVMYKDIMIDVNGVNVFNGNIKAPIVNDSVKNWMASHLYGSDSLIYIRDEPTINPNFANLEVAYSEASEQIKGNWIADRLQDNGDYIDYYNSVIGDICKIRITRTGGSNTYIEGKVSIIYLGRSISENSSGILWQLDSGTTCVIMLMPLLDSDARMATFFIGLRTASFPAHWRDNWTIYHRPVFYQADYTNGIGQAIYSIFRGYSDGTGGGNPYEGGRFSETTDETGDFDETSDIIGEPTLPASLAVASGFLTVYNPTYTQVVDLGNYVWNSLPVDTLKKMFSNPMDVIIGLSIFPFLIDDDGRNWEIMIGNINSHVEARKARNQFQVVDCGKLYIKPYSKSYLDYSPYTKIELALPYIGTKQLDTDIIMGKWIWVKYRVDLISGGCMAILSFSDTENGEYSVIAEYTGKCNIEIPISGSDFRELGRGILQAVAGTGAILLSNGAVGGDWVGSGLANMVTGMKPNIERSGGLTSCIGLLGVQKPRIIKTIPRQCVPENQAQLQGYPVLIKDNFANLEGFTSFEEVSIKGARMTEREKQRAKALLESGVIK